MTSIAIVMPTNIGDAVMAFGVIDRMRSSYPDSRITVFTSPRSDDLVRRHLFVDETVVFDKRWPVRRKLEFVLIHMGHYDMVVDLKNTLFPFLLGARRHTPFIRRVLPSVPMPDQYLSLVDKLAGEGGFPRGEIVLSDQEKSRLDELKVKSGSIFVFLAARGILKQYPQAKLRELIEAMAAKYSIVLCGESVDAPYYKVADNIPNALNLCGKTSMVDIFYLLKNYARGVLSVDTGAIHAASYCDVPIVALLGPTLPNIYGPWSSRSMIVRRSDLPCSPCSKPHCVHNSECMDIDINTILKSCRELFGE